jgi:hypothetical protein
LIKINNGAQFRLLLKALSDDIVDAHLHFAMHEALHTAFEEYPLVKQQSYGFWTLTLQAHLNSSVYALFRAYDKDRQALHLRGWLTTIRENVHLFDDAAFRERLKDNPYVATLAEECGKPDQSTLDDDIAACSHYDPIVKKLVPYRGNRIAHRNARSSLVANENNSNDHSLMYEDLRTLLARAKEILNRYSYMFDASIYATKAVGSDDFQYIFDAVHEKVELAEREWTTVRGLTKK